MIRYIAAGALAFTGITVTTRVLWPLVAPKVKGFIGESNAGLHLLPFHTKDCAHLHNLLLPGGRDTTQIDYILVTRYAAFVLEIKNYRGTIRGNPDRQQWIQVMPSGRTSPFFNPLRQNEIHVEAVRALLAQKYPNLPVHSLVVFHNNCTIPAVPNVIKMRYLSLAIKSRCQGDPLVSTEEVQDIKNILQSHMIRGRKARRQHDAKAFLAAETAKAGYQSKAQSRAKDAPLLYFGEKPAPPAHSAEFNKLTDSGAILNIRGKRASIEEFFEASKRDSHGNTVPHGANFDHFICPYTGDPFPPSEAKNLYHGLWIAYLRRNPDLVQYLRENTSVTPGDSFRCRKVLSSYIQDPDSFIVNARATDWYRNMERKQAERRKPVFQEKTRPAAHSSLSHQISDAEQRKMPHAGHKPAPKSYTRP